MFLKNEISGTNRYLLKIFDDQYTWPKYIRLEIDEIYNVVYISSDVDEDNCCTESHFLTHQCKVLGKLKSVHIRRGYKIDQNHTTMPDSSYITLDVSDKYGAKELNIPISDIRDVYRKIDDITDTIISTPDEAFNRMVFRIEQALFHPTKEYEDKIFVVILGCREVIDSISPTLYDKVDTAHPDVVNLWNDKYRGYVVDLPSIISPEYLDNGTEDLEFIKVLKTSERQNCEYYLVPDDTFGVSANLMVLVLIPDLLHSSHMTYSISDLKIISSEPTMKDKEIEENPIDPDQTPPDVVDPPDITDPPIEPENPDNSGSGDIIVDGQEIKTINV